MALAVRQQMVVDKDHAIHLQSPEFKPGSRVEVIVLMENEIQQAGKTSASFMVGAQKISIDAPADFSVSFESNLYGQGG